MKSSWKFISVAGLFCAMLMLSEKRSLVRLHDPRLGKL
jgi:hypothetical protein